MPTVRVGATKTLANFRVETLYREHHAWLRGWLRRRLHDRFDAEDLTHDTFERLFTRRDLAAVDEPRALLTTIAKGIVHNFYRRRSIEETYKEMLAQMPPDVSCGQEARAIVFETLVEIDRRLSSLVLIVTGDESPQTLQDAQALQCRLRDLSAHDSYGAADAPVGWRGSSRLQPGLTTCCLSASSCNDSFS